MEDTIEIPFGAKNSELIEATYHIPEGMEAIVDGDKVVIRKKESEDEKIRKALHDLLCGEITAGQFEKYGLTVDSALDWLEKQKEVPIEFNNAPTIDPILNDYVCKIYSSLHKENGGVLSFARLQHLAMDIQKWCKEQQPTELNEDDERLANTTISFLDDFKSQGYENAVECIDWVKSIKDRVLPQLKQYWDEEKA